MVHAKALHSKPFGGDTPGPFVTQLAKLTAVETRRIHVDKAVGATITLKSSRSGLPGAPPTAHLDSRASAAPLKIRGEGQHQRPYRRRREI